MKKRFLIFSTIFTVLLLKLSIADDFVLLFNDLPSELTQEQTEKIQRFENKHNMNYYYVIFDKTIDLKNLESFKLNLSLKKSIYPKKLSIKEKQPDYFFWKGTTNSDNGSVTLLVNGSNITGIIEVDMSTYSIIPLGEGIHVIEKEDYSIPFTCGVSNNESNDIHQTPNNDYKKTTSLTSSKEKSGSPLITVLVAYTDAAINAYGPRTEQALQNLIDLAESETNDYYSNSEIDTEIEVVHKYKVNYTEISGNSNETWWGCPVDKNLYNFKNTTDGYMDNIHEIRDLYFADICVLLVGDTSPFGQAYLMAGAPQAFAIVWSPKTVAKKTFAHEIAHLYGAAHQDMINPPYSYGIGYDNKPIYGTIMVVGQWVEDPYRLAVFSTPDVLYNGNIVIGDINHDNARVINNRAQTLSEFRVNNLKVNLVGPAFLAPYEQGTFTAYPSGGSGTYTNYLWWERNDDHTFPDKGIKAPPQGQWIPQVGWTGMNQITISRNYSFSLKCEITDSDYNTAYDIHSVDMIFLPKTKAENSEYFTNVFPKTIELIGNYPNPFNPSTKIKFGLPEDAIINFTIYSILGNKIRKLANKKYTKGYHELIWDGKNDAGISVSNGLYIYKLRSGKTILTKKMVLMQ